MAEEIRQRLVAKVAIVTAARRGIGLGIARRLVAEGPRRPDRPGAEALAEAVESPAGAGVVIGHSGRGRRRNRAAGVVTRRPRSDVYTVRSQYGEGESWR